MLAQPLTQAFKYKRSAFGSARAQKPDSRTRRLRLGGCRAKDDDGEKQWAEGGSKHGFPSGNCFFGGLTIKLTGRDGGRRRTPADTVRVEREVSHQSLSHTRKKRCLVLLQKYIEAALSNLKYINARS